jgi:transposase
MRAVLQAQINKTDRNDARGMAQMMRAGLYRPVHVKTLRSQKLYSHHVDLLGRLSAAMRHDMALPNMHLNPVTERGPLWPAELKTRV